MFLSHNQNFKTHQRTQSLLKLMFVIFALCGLVSCATERPVGQTEAEVLYKEADALKQKERYIVALEKLKEIREKHPYSYYSTHAELMEADIYYEQENYIEAATAYLLFKDFHPKHPQIPYVIWKIAEANFNQKPSTFDRDLSSLNEAMKYYQMLVDKFPEDVNSKAAIQKLKDGEHLFQEKEQYIADFYYKTEDYSSSIFRYEHILKNYKTESLRQHAINRIVQAHLNLKQCQEAQQKFNLYQSELKQETSDDLKNLLSHCLKS